MASPWILCPTGINSSCLIFGRHSLTGVKLKMSTSYHPETDGSSEQTNKTVIQCICYTVERDQKGWVKSLPKIRFDVMNTVNHSTGFTPFQLWFRCSPWLLPALFPHRKDTCTWISDWAPHKNANNSFWSPRQLDYCQSFSGFSIKQKTLLHLPLQNWWQSCPFNTSSLPRIQSWRF